MYTSPRRKPYCWIPTKILQVFHQAFTRVPNKLWPYNLLMSIEDELHRRGIPGYEFS